MTVFLQILMLILIAVMFFSVAGLVISLIEDGEFNITFLFALMMAIVLFMPSYELLKFDVSSEYNLGNGYSNNLKLEYIVKNEVENNYDEDDFDLEYGVTFKIENYLSWTDNYRISYDNIRVYIEREDDGIKVTYTCVENLKKTGLFTIKSKRAIYNTIKVSEKNKNKQESCPEKSDDNEKVEIDNNTNDKNK